MQAVRAFMKSLGTALVDLRYGAILKGKIPSNYSHLGATDTINSDYKVLEKLFLNQIRPSDVLVDIGCGKGRVLNWWLEKYRDREIYGIELDPVIAEQTRRRLRRHRNVTILTGDACFLIPNEGSLFYLFHPFDGTVMRRFAEEIRKNPRAANGLLRRIIYFNSIHIDVFEGNPCFSIKEVAPMYNLNGAVIDCTGFKLQNPSEI